MKMKEIIERIEIITKKEAVRMANGGYRMRCPVHKDTNPSFVLSYGTKMTTDGRRPIIGHCFGCNCNVREWTSAIGIRINDLYE